MDRAGTVARAPTGSPWKPDSIRPSPTPSLGENAGQHAGGRAAVYDVSTELHATGAISDATYQRALDRFGEQGIMDLIAVNGYYTLVLFTLNTDRTPLPAGVRAPLPDLK